MEKVLIIEDDELIAELERRCGKRVIGNRSASGTQIIEELGGGRDKYRCNDRLYLCGFRASDLRKRGDL